MKGNAQLGIDFGLDLVTPNEVDDSRRAAPNAPTLTLARFDPFVQKTIITGHVDTQPVEHCSYCLRFIDLYRSSALDAHGMAQGEKMLFPRIDWQNPAPIDANGDFRYEYNGNLTGQFISATVSRFYPLGKGGPTAQALQPRPDYYEQWQATSEMSAPLRVE